MLLDAGLDLLTTQGQARALQHAHALVVLGEADSAERAKAIAAVVKVAQDVAAADLDGRFEQMRKQVARVTGARVPLPALLGDGGDSGVTRRRCATDGADFEEACTKSVALSDGAESSTTNGDQS